MSGPDRRTVRFVAAAAAGAAAVSLITGALVLMAGDRGTGLLFALGCAGVASAVAALAVRWALAPIRAAERELIARLDGQQSGVPIRGELGPLSQAVGRLLHRHRSDVERLRRERLEVQRDLVLALRVSEQSRVGLAIVSREEGLFTFTNARFRELCRLRGEPLGRRPLEVVPAVEIHQAVESAAAGRDFEVSFATGWGDLKVRSELLDADHVTIRVEDISPEREAERSRSDFVANVSHELRTPITALMGYTETLLADTQGIPDRTVTLLATIERNARRLRDLFEDLLRLHRIETRRKQLPVEERLLHPVLVDAVVDAVDRGALRHVTLELDVDEGLNAWCHPDALVAMVGNLARNGVSYTDDGGHVCVRARREEGGVAIEVEDDGIGIDTIHQERIFERFYRVDEARSRRAGGTGLGLAIVKHYALATGATVDVRSVQGEGATFRIWLPDR